MAGGLFALLDDVALIARSAASTVDDVATMALKTSTHSAAVVIDDAAVAPQYVEGIKPSRELPVIWRITKGSLFNKLVIILPIALLLSAFAPWALTPILMCGGLYLCFEGAEKALHALLSHPPKEKTVIPAGASNKENEDRLVSAAIRTDLILSAEIMVISLNAVLDETLWMRLGILVLVAIFLTLGVYGAVGLLVKMDDLGLTLLRRRGGKSTVGAALVKAMPYLLEAISIIGTAAMLWVGGHLIVQGIHEFGVAQPYEVIHHLTTSAPNAIVGWLIETVSSMVCGILAGAIIVAVVTMFNNFRNKSADATT